MADTFQVLSDVEHVLARPSMYIGSTSYEEQIHFIGGKQTSARVVPGLVKIINELIDNSVDEFIRSGTSSMTVKITVSSNFIEISDNGRGIPVEIFGDTGKYQPEVAWTTLKAGTSFGENRSGPSANGIGSSLSVIYSKKFTGTSYDGKKQCKVVCTDNMSSVKTSVRDSMKHGVSVYMEPDFTRFEAKSIDNAHIMLIKERLYAISAIFSGLNFIFNNEKIAIKSSKEFLKSFGDEFIPYENKNYFFGVFPSEGGDEYSQFSNIDSLEILYGGTHEEVISSGITDVLRELIQKKHKIEMTKAEIKRGLQLVFCGRNFPGMKFNSQTKEKLTNSVAEVKSWLDYTSIPFEQIGKKILNNDAIIQPIIQYKLAKQAAADARAVTLAQKKLNGKKVKKHIPANTRRRNEATCFIVEGDSALSSLKNTRNPETQGGFPLRGKPLNTYDLPEKKILENEELKNLMAVLGLQFGKNDNETLRTINYGSICLLCDSDYDGNHIVTLVCNFLSRWKVLFEKNIVKYVVSPIIILEKGTQKKFFYTLSDYNAVQDKYKSWKVRYIKGLGGLEKDEYRMVLNDTSHHYPIKIDKPDSFDIMFSSNADLRKDFLKK